MVVVLIILNIVLIVILVFLLLYIFKKNKNSVADNVTPGVTNVCVSDDNCLIITSSDKQNDINSERVFDGIFITDEEYQQMTKNRKSDISVLLDEVNKEYEHLKELIK